MIGVAVVVHIPGKRAELSVRRQRVRWQVVKAMPAFCNGYWKR
jgi:hypothetical protein